VLTCFEWAWLIESTIASHGHDFGSVSRGRPFPPAIPNSFFTESAVDSRAEGIGSGNIYELTKKFIFVDVPGRFQ